MLVDPITGILNDCRHKKGAGLIVKYFYLYKIRRQMSFLLSNTRTTKTLIVVLISSLTYIDIYRV